MAEQDWAHSSQQLGENQKRSLSKDLEAPHVGHSRVATPGMTHVHKPHRSSTQAQEHLGHVQKTAASTGKKEPAAAEMGTESRQHSGHPAPLSDRSRVIGTTDMTKSSCKHRAARNSLLIISQFFF